MRNLPEYMKKRAADRRAAGLCPRCPNPLRQAGAGYCQQCQDKNNARSRRRRERAAAPSA